MSGPAQMPPTDFADEKTLMKMRPTRFIAFKYYLIMIISLALAAAFFLMHPLKKYADVNSSAMGLLIDNIVAIFFLLVSLYGFIHAELKRYTTLYTITDNKIIRRDGILNRNTQMIPYTMLNRVDLRQNIFQRILKIGTLVIDTGDDTLKIEMISHPSKVQDLLSQRIGRLSYIQQPQKR